MESSEIASDDQSSLKYEKSVDDKDFSSSAFETLERDFQDVLNELAGDNSLERFRLEYEKLHRTLKKSHEQEKRLVRKCRDLNGEIVNNASKVQAALKLSQQDQALIGGLRKEIEKAWTMVDIAHDKEVRAKETITQLKEEVTNLSKLVKKGAGLSMGQENMVKELLKTRDALSQKNDEQAQTILLYETEIKQISTAHVLLQAEEEKQRIKLTEAVDIISIRDSDIIREQRKRERMDKELKDSRQSLENKQMINDELTKEMAKMRQESSAMKRQIVEGQATIQRYLYDHDALYGRSQKLTEELEETKRHTHFLEAEISRTNKGRVIHAEEVKKIQSELIQMERHLEKEKARTEKYKALYEDSRAPLNDAKLEINILKQELDEFRLHEEQHKKAIEIAERDIGIQQLAIKKAQEHTRMKEDEVKESAIIANSLEADLINLKTEVSEGRKEIIRLVREREKVGSELSNVQSLYRQAQSQTKLKESRIRELEQCTTDWESKLTQQEQIYDAVRSERNKYCKSLALAEDEIADLKRKSSIFTGQIQLLKDEIIAKEHATVNQSFDQQKLERQRDHLQEDIIRLRKLVDSNEESINKQDSELRHFNTMIRKMETDVVQQKKEYNQVINERDILGTQLIRRNDEIALLYEKLKLQEITLIKGEAKYAERMSDLTAIRLKAQSLVRELSLCKNNSAKVKDLTIENLQIKKELTKSNVKVKALSEELENPMNVHRWRKLEGSDPAMFEMIQKVQMLQKRLIAKTEEVVKRDMIIQEKQKQYATLKNYVARQPGPEVAEQLSMYQASLMKKATQLKAMAGELNMNQSQVKEYQYEIERLEREVQETKWKYYELKRREETLHKEKGDNEVAHTLAYQQKRVHLSAVKHFAGGGFAFS